MNALETHPPARLLEVRRADALGAFAGVAYGCSPLAPEAFALRPPDVHLMRLQSASRSPDRLTARCSLWWTEAPALENERLGIVGHYAAETAAAGRILLEAATRRFQQAGCTRVAGPMDGATWRPHRFVTGGADPSEEPPFFLEPEPSSAHARHFRRAGFAPWVRYRSAQVPLSAENAPLQAMEDGRWRLRPLRPADFDEELHRLYRLATASFAENFLYTPMPEAVFRQKCRALRPRLDPGLVRIAERDGRPIGFCFAVPDHRRRERGKPVDTVVLKTLAVHPEARGRGLGARLVADVHRVACAKGYRRVIHALMREGNVSNCISDAYPGANTLRRYALFCKSLRS